MLLNRRAVLVVAVCKDFYSGPLVTPITCDPSYNNGQTGCLE
jgi:hypothetical protein